MSLARTAAGILGVAYVFLGVVGFLPDPLVQACAVPSATGAVLGILPINPLHNVVHLAIGAALLYASMSTATAIVSSRVIGVVLVGLGLLGVVAAGGFGLLPLGGGEIVLHLATGAVLLGIGLTSASQGRAT